MKAKIALVLAGIRNRMTGADEDPFTPVALGPADPWLMGLVVALVAFGATCWRKASTAAFIASSV